MTRLSLSSLALSAALVTSIMISVGCGEANDDVRSNVGPPQSSEVGACLQRAGATFATDADELHFLRIAELSGEVSGGGIAYDKKLDAVVEVFRAPDAEAEEWVVWAAQPFDTERSVNEILASEVPRSFVAYVRHPTRAQLRKVNQCVGFPGGDQPLTPAEKIPDPTPGIDSLP